MISVLLVDDHELVRTGIEALLNAVDDIFVMDVASCGEEALQITEQLSPDIILMDVNMPGMGGMEACRRLLQRHPQVKIIALSAYNDGFIPEQLLKLGASGFISKNSPVEEMVNAIRNVMSGIPYLCKDMVYNRAEQNMQKLTDDPFAQLSKREAEVTSLILQGRGIQEIAEMLNLSDKTINTYRYRLYEKLNVKNDVELIRLAVKSNYADSGLMLHDLKLRQPL